MRETVWRLKDEANSLEKKSLRLALYKLYEEVEKIEMNSGLKIGSLSEYYYIKEKIQQILDDDQLKRDD